MLKCYTFKGGHYPRLRIFKKEWKSLTYLHISEEYFSREKSNTTHEGLYGGELLKFIEGKESQPALELCGSL